MADKPGKPHGSAGRPRVLITAGPTHEPIDAVRYIANRSSGRMGLALAAAAVERGWPTTLLLGPVPIAPAENSRLRIIRFQTTVELQSLLAEHWPQHDVLLMAAAVADYRPTGGPPLAPSSAGGLAKLRRGDHPITLELQPTPDLLANLAGMSKLHQTVIGFALEPAERLVQSAQEKLARKRLDAIVANPLETMDSATVSATVFFRDGRTIAAAPNLSKPDFAAWLLDTLKPLFDRAGSGRA